MTTRVLYAVKRERAASNPRQGPAITFHPITFIYHTPHECRRVSVYQLYGIKISFTATALCYYSLRLITQNPADTPIFLTIVYNIYYTYIWRDDTRLYFFYR